MSRAPTPEALSGAALVLTLAVVRPALALDIVLPAETARYAENGLPGYPLVQQHCLVCHSAHYVQYQPPSSSREYWTTIVKKMQHPFGAVFPDTDVAPMVDYLVKTYGAERPAAKAPPESP